MNASIHNDSSLVIMSVQLPKCAACFRESLRSPRSFAHPEIGPVADVSVILAMTDKKARHRGRKRMTRRNSGFIFSVLFVCVMTCITCISGVTLGAEPVKIGYCVPLSGVYASLGKDMRDGLNLYMEEIEHKAGGRNIEVIVKNVSNWVTLALDTAYQLISGDKIDIVAGIVDSRMAYALKELIEKHEVPFVISNAGADDLTQRKASPLIVRPAFVNSAGSHPLGVWAYEQGFRKAVAIGTAHAGGFEHVGGICRTFTQQGGKIIQEIWPPLGTQDFRPFLEKINPDADVVMAFFAGNDALRFVVQYSAQGLKGKIPLIGKGFLVDDNILPQQGARAEGIVTECHWSALLETFENLRFKAAYVKKYGRNPTLYSEQGYVTGMAIAEALESTRGLVSGKNFVAAVRALELNAPRGKVKFDQYGAPIQASYIRSVQLVNGRWQNVIIKSYPSVSQFWTWKPEEFMEMTPYLAMRGKWTQ